MRNPPWVSRFLVWERKQKRMRRYAPVRTCTRQPSHLSVAAAFCQNSSNRRVAPHPFLFYRTGSVKPAGGFTSGPFSFFLAPSLVSRETLRFENLYNSVG